MRTDPITWVEWVQFFIAPSFGALPWFLIFTMKVYAGLRYGKAHASAQNLMPG